MNLKPTSPALHYVGFDLHRRTIAVCVKTADGTIVEQQTLPARRPALLAWAQSRTAPWAGAMEATIFTGWVYDLLKPMAFDLKAAHPLMLRAIIASKKKTTASMPANWPTPCAATCCRNATSLPARSVNCAACCATGTWFCARRCG